MSKNALTLIAAIIACWTNLAAADPNCQNDYIAPAKQELLTGTLSGIRQANYILNIGMQKSICAGDRELLFLHAATKAAMLFIENGSANNFNNIANDFGITIVGDYFNELKVDVLKFGDCYEIPAWAPDANELSQRIQQSIIPEINDIIAELNSISDSPADRFQIFFEPNETGLDKRVIVDYAEVLILKGAMAALKSELEFRQAYNLAVDINDPKIEELINSTFCGQEPNVNFSINGDFLQRYANLLTVLPDGNAVLLQAKQDLVTAINYYSTTINYILSEANDQHLLYIDSSNGGQADAQFFSAQLLTLRDSLLNDTAGSYPLEITKTYRVYQNSAPVGQLVLIYEPFDNGINAGHKGTLVFDNDTVTPPWKSWVIDNFDGGGGDLSIDFSYEFSDTEWKWGYFEGTLSSDGNNITNGVLYYEGEQCCPWAWYEDTVSGLSASLIDMQTVYKRLDPNPVLGGSVRYHNSVNPRDLLPAFDSSNKVVPCTFGHGLKDDATLGGILPDTNQLDWSYIFKLPDCGSIGCPLADIASLQGTGITDCFVNIYDFAALASHWLNLCSQPNWCGNADFDKNGKVELADFVTLAEEWLQRGDY